MTSEFGGDYHYLRQCESDWRKPTYKAWWLTRAYLEVVRPTELTRNSRILSVGSGMGQLEHFLEKYFGYKVYQSDLNFHAIKTNHRIFGPNRSLVASAFSLPYKDNFFDFVLSYDLLEHMPSIHFAQMALNEMERVLNRKGGMKMFHKITVLEEPEAIDGDPTHHIKWNANIWKIWFEKQGWKTAKPISHKIPVWSRKKIGFYPVEGAFYLRKSF